MTELQAPKFQYQIRGSTRNISDPTRAAKDTEERDRQLEDYLNKLPTSAGGGATPTHAIGQDTAGGASGPTTYSPVFGVAYDPDGIFAAANNTFTLPGTASDFYWVDLHVEVALSASITPTVTGNHLFVNFNGVEIESFYPYPGFLPFGAYTVRADMHTLMAGGTAYPITVDLDFDWTITAVNPVISYTAFTF